MCHDAPDIGRQILDNNLESAIERRDVQIVGRVRCWYSVGWVCEEIEGLREVGACNRAPVLVLSVLLVLEDSFGEAYFCCRNGVLVLGIVDVVTAVGALDA